MAPIETTHLIAQYLAAAAISFLEPKDDDSHTNLGFNTTTACLETHALNDSGVKLVFDYHKFSLLWQPAGTTKELHLAGQTHARVLSWLKQTTASLDFEKPYVYQFHYELPYQLENDTVLSRPKDDELENLVEMRKLAQLSCQQFAELLDKPSDIRIWPHHFDTGGYATHSTDPDRGVGWGMAIPDSVSELMYFYIGYYKKGEPYLPADLPELSLGQWVTEGFTGAILTIDQYLPAAFAFFAEVHKAIGECDE